jgi:hypothetical protein
LYSEALIVGQDEDPLALVGRADFTRAEYSPRRRVTCCSQVSEDFAESQANVALDIFKKAESGANNSNCPKDVGPEVAGVFGSEAFACCAEGLAGITGHKQVHAVSKGFAWEGFNIRPERCRVQESRFHFCNQVRAGEGFDLTISDDAQIRDCSSKSEMNPAVSGAPLDGGKLFGSIHIIGFVW